MFIDWNSKSLTRFTRQVPKLSFILIYPTQLAPPITIQDSLQSMNTNTLSVYLWPCFHTPQTPPTSPLSLSMWGVLFSSRYPGFLLFAMWLSRLTWISLHSPAPCTVINSSFFHTTLQHCAWLSTQPFLIQAFREQRDLNDLGQVGAKNQKQVRSPRKWVICWEKEGKIEPRKDFFFNLMNLNF